MKKRNEKKIGQKNTSNYQLFRNALFNSGGWVLNIAVALATTPYFVYKLGADGYGVFALMTGLIGYYGLLDVGLGQGVTKFVAEYRTQDDQKALSASINAALLVQVSIGILASVLLVVFVEQVLGVLNLPDDLYEEARSGIYICSGGFFFQMIGNTFASALKGIQRYDVTAKINVLVRASKNLGIAVALFAGNGLVSAFWLAASASILSFISNLVLAWGNISRWKLTEGVSFKYAKKLFKFSGFLFISKVSSILHKYVARFVITYFLGPSAVTYFVVPQKVTNAAGGIIGRGFEVVFPYASELQALSDPERIRRLLMRGTHILASLAFPMFLLIILFAKPLLSYWIDAAFAEEAWHVLSLLSSSALLGALTTVTNQIAIGLGYTRLKSLFSVSEILVFSVLVVVLTPWFGVIGTVSAIILMTLTVGYAFVFYFTNRILGVDLFPMIKDAVGINVIPLIASPLLLLLVNRVLKAKLALLIPTFLILGGGYLALLVASERIPLRQLIRFARRPQSK
ncbi:O-antigen/teichoic acid export membrane protein [Salinibacter ruber]|uniref:oligosaccharide flippase family protein n=1 Tax=Salinibacter ruber TaxID=146919 RepID=UPI00216A378E|nr:oligosaccharide flippase family protein [Salinibacter ruber]MCS4034101.1 O-antigen/teichoic acid export membrane protein [Salinibacter ruber]